MLRINAKDIGIKTPIKVDETIAKVKETFKYQKDVLKTSETKGKNDIEKAVSYYDGQMKSIGMMIDYVTDMLDLDVNQIKKLNKADFPKVMSLSDQIVRKMLHYGEGNNNPKAAKK